MTANPYLTDQAIKRLSHRLAQEYGILLSRYGLGEYIEPATIALSKSQLAMGEWHTSTRIISLSTKLCDGYSWPEIVEVLKHEIAHQIEWEYLGQKPGSRPHGKLFQQACDMVFVAPWARGARVHKSPKAPSLEEICSEEQSPWELKIKKLLSLSQSSNEHEAHLAFEKARELSEKHQLWCLVHLEETQEIHTLSLSLLTKRRSELHGFLSMILGKYFGVKPIFNYEWSMERQCDLMVLDLVGHAKNLLMAEYIYHYLIGTFDRLWKARKKVLIQDSKNPRHMRVAKNSYYRGLMLGFLKKMEQSQQKTSATEQKLKELSENKGASATEKTLGGLALTAKESSLSQKYNDLVDQYCKKKYPQLTRTKPSRSRRLIDPGEIKAGEKEGVKITVSKALGGKPTGSPRLLASSND